MRDGFDFCSLVAQTVKNLPAVQETGVWSLGWEDEWQPPGEMNGNPLQGSCLENSMDKRNVAVYNPWGHKETQLSD